MNMISALVLYCLEIVRYVIGSKVLFEKTVKRKWIALVFGVLYAGYVENLVWYPRGKEYLEIDLLIYIIIFFTIFLMLERSIWKKVFQVFCLFCLFACLDEIVSIGIFHVLGKEKYTLLEESIIECLVVIVFLCIMLLIKILVNKNGRIKDSTERESVYIAILFVSLCLAGAVCGIGIMQRKGLKEISVKYDIFSGITYLCIIGIILFVFYIRKVNEQRMRLVKIQQMLNNMQKEYYQSLLEKEKETKKYRHDMNNHLMYLHTLVENNREAKEYIEKLQENLTEIKEKCYLTGNEVLDVLLNHYLSGYDKAEVTVIGKCDSSLSIDSVDFCSIFSNLIKNAIEDIERENLEEKYIRINIKQGKQYLMVELKNSSRTLINENDKKVKTKKTDAENHGIGLLNVRETIEKNGGTFSLSGDGKEVTAKVILKLEK